MEKLKHLTGSDGRFSVSADWPNRDSMLSDSMGMTSEKFGIGLDWPDRFSMMDESR